MKFECWLKYVLVQHNLYIFQCASDSDKEEADKHKVQGNELMKQEKFSDALACYNKAIDIDDNNAVYFCNRYSHNYLLAN